MAVFALAERAGVAPAWGARAVLLSWLSISLVCVMMVIAWMGCRAGISGAGVGGWCGLGRALAWSWKASQSTDSFQPAASVLGLGTSRSVCPIFKSSVSASCNPRVSPTNFQTSLKRVHFPGPDPRARMPNMGLEGLSP